MVSEWAVMLKGEALDLQDLAGQFRSAELSVIKESDGHYLRAAEFATLQDSNEVRDRAVDLIKRLNGVAKLFHSNFRTVEFGGWIVEDREGKSTVWCFPPPVVGRSRASATGLVIDKDPEAPLPSTVSEIRMAIAATDDRVARALRLFGYEHTWDTLYKVYEAIAEDVGSGEIRNKWPEGHRLNAFKRTANNHSAVGDAARHGSKKHSPPRNPMSLYEATNLIGGWLKHWLESK